MGELGIWISGGAAGLAARGCFEKTKPISDARRDGEQGKRKKCKSKMNYWTEPRTAGDSYLSFEKTKPIC